MTPADRSYAKSHGWVRVEDDVATIGITEYAQEALGEITFVELPTVGERVTRGSDCGVIESVKAANDFLAPISGVVIEVNSRLEEEPELVNQDPYEDGWLFKLANISERECDGLLDAEAYEMSLD